MVAQSVAKGKNRYAYVIVAACCAIVFAASGLALSCASVFYAVVAEAFGVGRGTFSIYMTVALLVMSFSMPIQGKLVAKMHVRTYMLIASACFVGSFVIFALAPNVFFFYIGAIPQGFGLAVPAFILVPLLVNRWFKKRTGFFIGLIMAFTGLTALVMNPILSTVITNYGWRAGYWVIVVVAAVLMFVPTLLLKNDPAEMGLAPVGADEAPAAGASAAATPVQAAVSLKQAMGSSAFYLLCLMAAAVSFVQALNFYWVAYATEIGYGLVLASVIGSVAMLGQMIGKIALGALSDKAFKPSVALAYGVGIIGLGGTLVLGAHVGTAVLLVFIFLFGVTYASGSVMNPIVTQNCFGVGEDYAKIYSNITSVGTFCAAIGSTAYGFIIDFGGYSAAFAIGTALCVVCLVCAFGALKISKRLRAGAEQPAAAVPAASSAPAK